MKETDLAQYFDNRSEWAQYSKGATRATWISLSCIAEQVDTTNISEAAEQGKEPKGISWQERQISILNEIQTVESVKGFIRFRIENSELEEYEEFWHCGEGSDFSYADEESFLQDVDWHLVSMCAKEASERFNQGV